MEKRIYDVSLTLTADEAESLIEAAGMLGVGVDALLSRIVEDIHQSYQGNQGDESRLMGEYLERRREPGPSFVAFCNRTGQEVDYLGDLCQEITAREESIQEMKSEGVEPGEIHFEEEILAETRADRDSLWGEYLESAGGLALSLEEALKEAETWGEEAFEFSSGWKEKA